MQTRTETDPVAAEVRFVPETGTKRPWEVWLTSARGAVYQRGSFKTQAGAAKKAAQVRSLFNF